MDVITIGGNMKNNNSGLKELIIIVVVLLLVILGLVVYKEYPSWPNSRRKDGVEG